MDKGHDFNHAAAVANRFDALIARKRADNEQAISRIGALEASWRELNNEIDRDLKRGLDAAGAEASAMEDAKERLKRSVCEGVGKDAYAIAGKVVDVDSKVGLPGLYVVLTVNDQDRPIEAQTDAYGDFFVSLPLETGRAAARAVTVLMMVRFGSDLIVHREQHPLEPQPGAVDHFTLAVECGARLKDVLDHGKQVRASVENDAKLVASRAANLEVAYETFKAIPDTVLSRLRMLKRDLSTKPPAPAAQPCPPGEAAPTPAVPPTDLPVPPPAVPRPVPVDDAPDDTPAPHKTRYLGNSRSHEVHDLEHETKQCQIDSIARETRVYFRTKREATAAKYDSCAYCFGKQRSKR